MSTAAPVTPPLAGTLWAELAGELGVGLLLRDKHGGLQDITGWATELLELTEDGMSGAARGCSIR